MLNILDQIKNIKKGDEIIYHTGVLVNDCETLGADRMHNREKRKVAYDMYTAGWATLYQSRIGKSKVFEYIIKGV